MLPEKNTLSFGHNQPAAPLKCWDIFMDGYLTLHSLAGDLQQLNKFSRKHAWRTPWDMEEKLLQQRKVVLITNAGQEIVFASSNIFSMNGYLPAEVIGKTPKMFQGKATNTLGTAIIREAVATWQPFHVPLLNYKKNGEPYTCDIEGFPVFNQQRKLVHFIAFETSLV